MATRKSANTEVSKPLAGPRNVADALKVTMWFIKEVGGVERAKTLISTVSELEEKLANPAVGDTPSLFVK